MQQFPFTSRESAQPSRKIGYLNCEHKMEPFMQYIIHGKSMCMIRLSLVVFDVLILSTSNMVRFVVAVVCIR